MKLIIYLADLTHTTVTVSIDTFPLGIGNLAAYVLKHSDVKLEIRLFRFYDDIMQAVRKRPPHILGITNYTWNLHLSRHVLKLSRQLKPDILTVMGGPNIPGNFFSQKAFLELLPEVDIHVVGEGEQAFCNLVKEFAGSNKGRKELISSKFPSCLVRRPDGKIFDGISYEERINSLDDIPSPYLTGLMDHFFEKRLYPMIETSRGCPFTCTYCCRGENYYNKVNRFSFDRVSSELKYISARSQTSDTLFIADSNFGMNNRDLQIAAYIGRFQKETGWPKFINCTTGKNNPKVTVKTAELLNGAMVIHNSVQSMNDEVLKNVKRQNIKTSTYFEIQEIIKEKSLKSMADMILCLPGETKETHFQGVKELLDSGIQRILPFQLILLHGAEISTPETRKRFGFQAYHRIVPRNFGFYDNKIIFESEEIVVSTNTLSFMDYLECRKLHLLLEIYFKEEPFFELFELAKLNGISRSDILFHSFKSISIMPVPIQQLLESFLDDTQNEIFESRKDLMDYVINHKDDILSGKFGANLLQKYSVSAWFLHLNSVVSFLEQIIINLAKNKMSNKIKLCEFEKQIKVVAVYLKKCYVNIFNNNYLQMAKKVNFTYDIAEWIKHGYRRQLELYKIKDIKNHEFVIRMSDARVKYIQDKISTFGISESSLGKMLTRMWLSDLKRDVIESVSL